MRHLRLFREKSESIELSEIGLLDNLEIMRTLSHSEFKLSVPN